MINISGKLIKQIEYEIDKKIGICKKLPNVSIHKNAVSFKLLCPLKKGKCKKNVENCIECIRPTFVKNQHVTIDRAENIK